MAVSNHDRWALSEDHANHHWWASANLKKKATGTGGPSLVSAYNVMTQVCSLFPTHPLQPPMCQGPFLWCTLRFMNKHPQLSHLSM